MKFKFKLEDRNKYTYTTYRALVEEGLSNGETTDKDESEEMLEFTKVNIARMTRWDKTAKINDRLKGALVKTVRQRWIVLSEGWCGDAAQNLPIISKMVDFSFNVEMDILLREENLDIMDKYLTNKGRSIPKLIAIDENNEVLFTWGPRPKKMQDRVLELKKAKEEYAQDVHKMYAKDRAVTIQAEFTELLNGIKK